MSAFLALKCIFANHLCCYWRSAHPVKTISWGCMWGKWFLIMYAVIADTRACRDAIAWYSRSHLPPESGCILPANIRMNVVFPVPFSPNITMISESVNSPGAIVSSNSPATNDDTLVTNGGFRQTITHSLPLATTNIRQETSHVSSMKIWFIGVF